MDLLGRIEVMHAFGQLSDDQQANMFTNILAQNRSMMSQLLSDHLAAHNNTPLAIDIKKAANELLEADDLKTDTESNTASAVIPDPLILSNIARFLTNQQIISLERLNRRCFISLRKYPAITNLGYSDIDGYFKYCPRRSMTPNTDRYRNVRKMVIHGDQVAKLAKLRVQQPIFEKVETLICDDVLENVADLKTICDLDQVQCLAFDELCESTTQVQNLIEVLFVCGNIRELRLSMPLVDSALDLDSESQFQALWKPHYIRERLPRLRVLHFMFSDYGLAPPAILQPLFDAVSPQLESFSLVDNGESYWMSHLFGNAANLNNLNELCWTMLTPEHFEHGIEALSNAKMQNLQRLHISFHETFGDGDVDLSGNEKRAFVDICSRDLNHIGLFQAQSPSGQDLVDCLKKGLLQRDKGGNISIALDHWYGNEEADLLDILGRAKLCKLDGFAVMMEGKGPDPRLLVNAEDIITVSNGKYFCCRSADFEATQWISHCTECDDGLSDKRTYAELLLHK